MCRAANIWTNGFRWNIDDDQSSMLHCKNSRCFLNKNEKCHFGVNFKTRIFKNTQTFCHCIFPDPPFVKTMQSNQCVYLWHFEMLMKLIGVVEKCRWMNGGCIFRTYSGDTETNWWYCPSKNTSAQLHVEKWHDTELRCWVSVDICQKSAIYNDL